MSSSVSEPMTQRLFDLLERLRRLRRGRSGNPALTRLDNDAGHARGHLRRQLKGDIRMSAEDLFGIFDLLEADPEEYVSAARHGRVPLDLWLSEMVQEDRRQLRLLRPDGKARSPRDLDASLLRLDELLRLGKPEAADRGPYLAAGAALEGQDNREAGSLLFRVWDLLGASFRISSRYSCSAACYHRALKLSQNRPLDRAHILRRACYLASDQCEFEAALCFAEEAQDAYRRHFELAGLGRAWIDSAIVLTIRGHREDAVQRYQAGLQVLDDDPFYCLAAYQGMGLCLVRLGRIEEAREYLRRGQDLHRGMPKGPEQLTGLHWLSAEIALSEGDLYSSRVLLERIRSIHLGGADPLEVAAVSLRLAKVLLLLADFEALERLSVNTAQLMAPLRRHQYARSALIEFHRLLIEKKLTGKRLDRLFLDFIRRGRSTRRVVP